MSYEENKIKKKIDRLLKIEDVAKDLLGTPEKQTNRYDLYHSFYSEDNNASFYVYKDSQSYSCYSTKHSGDVCDFYKDYSKFKLNADLSYYQVFEELIQKYGLSIDLKSLSAKQSISYSETDKQFIDLINLIIKYSRYSLGEELNNAASQVAAYFHNRSISIDTIKYFSLGYVPLQSKIDDFIKVKADELKITIEKLHEWGIFINGVFAYKNNLIIPAKDNNDNFVSFFVRAIDENSGYRYKQLPVSAPQIASDYLFGFSDALHNLSSKEFLVLVEGPFDVMRLYEKGYKNAAAILTTTCNDKQILQLEENCNNIEIVSMLDSDVHGKETEFLNLDKLANCIEKNGSFMFSLISFVNDLSYIKSKKDPDEYFKDHNDIDKVISSRIDYRNYVIEQAIQSYKDGKYKIKDLYKRAGLFLNRYNGSLLSGLHLYIQENKTYDLDSFENYFYHSRFCQTLYLMNALNAEKKYCENLVDGMYKFVEKYKKQLYYFEQLKNRIIKKFGFSFSYIGNQYYSYKQKKDCNEKNSLLVYEIKINKTKYFIMELDYIADELKIYIRENNFYNQKPEKRNNRRSERNFFMIQVFDNFSCNKNELIEKEINIHLND